MARSLRFALVVGAALAAASPARALPLLSEVLYDASGSDAGLVFVELVGTPGASLDDLTLEGVNGSGGSITESLALTGSFPADGLFVVAGEASGGGTDVPDADLVLDFDFQNGPDSVVLRGPGGVVDALGYGEFGPDDVFAGEGSPAPDAPAGSSLARILADVDTDDNAADFQVLDVPTPGRAPRAVSAPGPGALAATGLGAAAMASSLRRRRL